MDSLKPGESNEDVLINDINNPYTQEEIYSIANIKAYDENLGDITNYIILTYDEYKNNETKEGLYIQTYEIDIENINEKYNLIIYNVNFKEYDYIETIELDTYKNKYLSESEILTNIIKKFNIKIYKYELIQSNYLKNSKTGTYYNEYIIQTTNNDKINILVKINVKDNRQNNQTLIYTSIIIFILIIILVIFKIYKKRRSLNV